MNRKKVVVGIVAAALLAVGGFTAMAAGQSPTTQQGSSAQEEQPSYKGSIAAPEEQGSDANEGNEAQDNEAADEQEQGNETTESRQLESLAKIDQATAELAALKAVPGTVKNTELENENGFVVYGVEIAGNDGKTHDVKVDAGNAEVLHQDVDGAEEDSGSEDVG
ncbi:MAG: PepSY domain-containing protein [Rubrobacter sp.]|nr:PepSY domain-containing protein [Rubrobacter sp.]